MQLCHSEPACGFQCSTIWPRSHIFRVWVSQGSCSLVCSTHFHLFLSSSHKHKRSTFLTSTGDLRASLEYSLSLPRSLVSCRPKGQAGQEAAGADHHHPALHQKPWRQRGETQGQQCAHGPCSHPLWKRCLSPVSRNILERKRSQLYEGWQSIVCGRDSCEAARIV